MSHSYYQTADPTWGTSSFRFGPPPAPSFQAQPSWGGLDYYNAHADSPDPSLYHHARNRLCSHSCISGVGVQEARHWHTLVYGGLGEIQTLTSYEFGYAAAYEAYRTWLHNSSIYAPISSDRERQREALIGLAIAEVSRLRRHVSRAVKISRRDSCEAAAATASILFDTFLNDSSADPYSAQHSLHRSRSFSGFGYPLENYAYDDDIYSHRHKHRRHGSSSPSMVQHNHSPYHSSSAIPISGATGHSPYRGSSPYHGGTSPYNGTYGLAGTSPYMGGSSPYGAGGSSPYGTGVSSYPIQTSYAQPAATTGSYLQPAYAALPGYPASQPTTYVIQQPSSSSGHRHRHHRHGSGHHHRSRRHRSHSDASYPAPHIY